MRFISTIILLSCLPLFTKAQLDTSILALEEFVFVSKVPIKISNDSIAYLLDSFSKNPFATTEEALQKLLALK